MRLGGGFMHGTGTVDAEENGGFHEEKAPRGGVQILDRVLGQRVSSHLRKASTVAEAVSGKAA